VRYAQAAHRSVESDRMIYLPVFDHSANPLGTIMRLLIDRRSGRLDQVVVLTHGHFGSDRCEIELPWARLLLAMARRKDTDAFSQATILRSDAWGLPRSELNDIEASVL
jgi:hypothetical protein